MVKYRRDFHCVRASTSTFQTTITRRWFLSIIESFALLLSVPRHAVSANKPASQQEPYENEQAICVWLVCGLRFM